MDYAFYTQPSYPDYVELPPSYQQRPIEDDGALETPDLKDGAPFFSPHYDAFRFDPSSAPPHAGHYDPTAGAVGHVSPPGSRGSRTPMQQADGAGPQQVGVAPQPPDSDPDRTNTRSRDNSEEKEAMMTPAQSRRKAQNRAAQRAFRERKERHVRDLEAKLTELESSSHQIQSDNEALKLALHRARTENKLLRATSGASRAGNPTSGLPPSPTDAADADLESQFPQFPHVDPADDAAVAALDHANDDGDHRSVVPPCGSGTKSGHASPGPHATLVTAAATWDLIQAHHLVSSGQVDISEVWDRLKSKTKCNGAGPAFEERDIWRAIEEGRRGGGDELI